jgi:hypothetical protein
MIRTVESRVRTSTSIKLKPALVIDFEGDGMNMKSSLLGGKDSDKVVF